MYIRYTRVHGVSANLAVRGCYVYRGRLVCMQIARLHELYTYKYIYMYTRGEKMVLIFPRIAIIRLLNKHTHALTLINTLASETHFEGVRGGGGRGSELDSSSLDSMHKIKVNPEIE